MFGNRAPSVDATFEFFFYESDVWLCCQKNQQQVSRKMYRFFCQIFTFCVILVFQTNSYPTTVNPVEFSNQILNVNLDPDLLNASVQGKLLNILLNPQILNVNLNPQALSPSILPQALGINMIPEILNLNLQPQLLTPLLETGLLGIHFEPQILRYRYLHW